MSRLSELVSILTSPHLHGGSTQEGLTVGIEEGLLIQLEQAVGSSGSGVGGGNSDRAGLPIDLGALDLLTHIVKEVNSHLPKSLWRTLSVPARVQTWEGTVQHDEEQAAHMERKLEQWVDRIREHFDPTPRRQLPEVSCPECLTAALPRIMDGETVMVPPITIYPKSLVAECLKCEATWTGREGLMRLRLHQKGDSV